MERPGSCRVGARARPLSPRVALDGREPWSPVSWPASRVSTSPLKFPCVSGKRASATPVLGAHSLYFGKWENLPRIAPYLCCHSGGLIPFLSGRGVGGPSLASYLRVRHSSDTLIERTRRIGDERRKWVSAPPQRYRGPRLGFRDSGLLMKGLGCIY